MKATLMRSALALSLVLVSLSACSGSGGDQALPALKKSFRVWMEDFATKGAWVNRDYQVQDNSSTISATNINSMRILQRLVQFLLLRSLTAKP